MSASAPLASVCYGLAACARLRAYGTAGSDIPVAPSGATGACPTCYVWKPLRIGAGGWLAGLDIPADGSTRVVRTDTYGAYIWDSGQWKQVVTLTSMPAGDVGVEKNAGVSETRVAPGDPRRLYLSYRGFVYRSNDRGAHWARTAFAQFPMDATTPSETSARRWPSTRQTRTSCTSGPNRTAPS